jgi:predicted DNA binding CopG/RHH family protein
MNRKEPNLCVRFKLADRARVQITAAEQNLPISTWVRETILVRAERVLSRKQVPPLVEFTRPKQDSEQICIRFRESDWSKIKRAAAIEKCLPSTWIRAVVVNAIAGDTTEKKRKPAA